ncbi:hypothetical protein UFOVP1669_18 [uncultured Caudovirales phage]|uniref:Uncharacterized protein n=1 Tax=uncultured Caudovirales phage TaxID=2100421 RepID=A0A6J5T5Y7_9CAUD|nr:hypothetical protein UFOVP494_6 [uncultured Caudovirales phage]CAB4191207.1 hypothetical protein UFOVP1223_15 [uncultured Caudovirales phage]CAB4223000.1 hypothetical protein UFOVP1669_18 [uncultured Caudovirales phage]
MAIVYQGSGQLTIATHNISLNCSNITLEVGYDSLDASVMGNTGYKYVGGLQTVSLSATILLEYGATSVEFYLSDLIGDGDTTVIVAPDTGVASPGNPIFTISNLMISSYMPISSTVGSLDTMTLSGSGGTWVRATA